MHHRLYYHLVWTTRERAPLIDAGLAGFLCRFLRAMATKESAQIIELGIVSTHVHLLLRTEPVTDLPRLIQLLKGASSHLGRKEGHSSSGKQLRWAQGYSLETVSERQLPWVREYIRSQPVRHPAEAIHDWSGDIAGVEYAQ
jgi:REP-associated tyrosine transposase